MKIFKVILLNCYFCLYGTLAESQFQLNTVSPTENELLQNSCGFVGNIEQHRWKRSVNSRLTTRREAPWVVLLRTIESETEFYGVTRTTFSDCSGSLISQRHALVAAHCFENVYGNETHDVIDSTVYITDCGIECNNQEPTIKIKVKNIILPREYFVHEREHRADIAIVELERDVDEFSDYVRPVCLGGFDVFPDTAVNLFGYGDMDPEELTSKAPKSKHNLQTITTYILENCTYPTPDSELQDEICTRNDKDKPRPMPLHGDSGAGGVVENDNRTYVIGVYKGTESFGVTGYPEFSQPDKEVYTRVAPHLFWICQMSGVCVDNLSGNQITAAETVITDSLTVDINGNVTAIEVYPILIKSAGVTWSASHNVPFENSF